METIYSDGKTLEIERMLKITVFLPQRCYFCKDLITTFESHKAESLVFHSLDGNHDNWEPSNKRPAHGGCHIKYHNTGKQHTEEFKNQKREAWLGDKNPMANPVHRAKHFESVRTPEYRTGMSEALTGRVFSEQHRKNISDALTGKPKPWMMGDKNHMRRPEHRQRMSERVISEETRQKLSDALTGRIFSEEHRQNLSESRTTEERSEAAKKAWQTRRERYPPNGMKPKEVE